MLLISPREVVRRLETELDPGERFLWQGGPQDRRFPPASIAVFLFAIPWTLFSLFWTVGAALVIWQGDAPNLFLLFPLMGLPFVLLGVAGLSSPIWMRAYLRRSAYGITNKRVIVVQGGFSCSVHSFFPEDLRGAALREKRDGVGDIILTLQPQKTAKGLPHINEKGLYGVRPAGEIFRLIRTLAHE